MCKSDSHEVESLAKLFWVLKRGHHTQVPIQGHLIPDRIEYASYCPLSRNTGFCGNGWLFDWAGPALNGAGRAVIRVSGVLPPVARLLVVVVMIAIAPASHMLA